MHAIWILLDYSLLMLASTNEAQISTEGALLPDLPSR